MGNVSAVCALKTMLTCVCPTGGLRAGAGGLVPVATLPWVYFCSVHATAFLQQCTFMGGDHSAPALPGH